MASERPLLFWRMPQSSGRTQTRSCSSLCHPDLWIGARLPRCHREIVPRSHGSCGLKGTKIVLKINEQKPQIKSGDGNWEALALPAPQSTAEGRALFFPRKYSVNTSPLAQTVKRLPAMWETRVRSLGRGDPLEKGMAAHSSALAWKIPWTEEPGRFTVHGVAKSQTGVSDFTHSLSQ